MVEINEIDKIKKRFIEIGKPGFIDKSLVLPYFKQYLGLIENHLDKWDETKFATNESPVEIVEKIQEDLPEKGVDPEEIYHIFADQVVPTFTNENVNFFGFVPRDPAPPAMVADALTPFFNRFLGSALAAPAATAIEALSIKWIGNMLGYKGDFFGSYTIGGSNANLEGMYAGVVNTVPWDYRKIGAHGPKKPIIYTSDQAHMCIRKAMMTLGLGLDNLRVIKSDECFRLPVEQLRRKIEEDISEGYLPVMIVGSAGTTNTGSIDDLHALYQLTRKYDMWFHVDAAYGGFARIAGHPVAEQLEDLGKADSIAIDTHKWLYTPTEGGLVLVKNRQQLKKAFDESAEYLVDAEVTSDHELLRNFSSYGSALTRKWRGLMVWYNIKVYGKKGLSQLITRNIVVADYLRQRIREHRYMELVAEASLGTVCFRWVGDDDLNLKLLQQMMNEATYFIGRTTLKGQLTLRICILNMSTTPEKMDELIEAMERLAERISSREVKDQ